MCKKWIYCKDWSTTTPYIQYINYKCLKNLGACEWVAVHTMDILHLTSVIRDFTFYKCLLYVSHLSNMCMSRTDTEFLYRNASPRIRLTTRPFLTDEARDSSEDQVDTECSLSFLQSRREPTVHQFMREYACWGKLPMTCGGRCSTVSPLPSLPVSPTHARPCNSPITQWRMSRCCEILFLKCTCLNSL